jgi:dephospho-CoA kinase
LLDKDVKFQKEVIKKFGHSIVNDEGKVDRKKLGELIFSSPE